MQYILFTLNSLVEQTDQTIGIIGSRRVVPISQTRLNTRRHLSLFQALVVNTVFTRDLKHFEILYPHGSWRCMKPADFPRFSETSAQLWSRQGFNVN